MIIYPDLSNSDLHATNNRIQATSNVAKGDRITSQCRIAKFIAYGRADVIFWRTRSTAKRKALAMGDYAACKSPTVNNRQPA